MKRSSKKILLITAVASTLLLALGFLYERRPFSQTLASFATDLRDRSSAQRRNIEIASQKINGSVLKPGAAFSFNQNAGPYTAAQGFLPERVFKNQHVAIEEGGGVCQLASTLYNAVIRAKLEIVERHLHSLAVRSVPSGWDAAVADGIADLKFSNPYPFPVKIIAQIQRQQLKVEIWGKEPSHE